MILGVGADLCRVSRIRRSVERLGAHWTVGVFTPEERDWCMAAPDPGLAFARGFAVKEAVSKALGTGFSEGVQPQQIVWRCADAEPRVVLFGQAQARLQTLGSPSHDLAIKISLSGSSSLVSCLATLESRSRTPD